MQKGITKLYRFTCGYRDQLSRTDNERYACIGVIYVKRGAQRWAIMDARRLGWSMRNPYGWVCPECKKLLDAMKKERIT